MVATRTTYRDALDANLNELHQDGLKMHDEQYSVIFNLETSDQQSEKDSYMSGFGAMPKKTEGAAATYDTPIAGISKTYIHDTYALGYEITEEAIEDNLHKPDSFNKLPMALAKSAMHTVETAAANVINNGWATDTGYDGQYLFSTAHPRADGGTQSNTPSTAADLSQSSLTAALTAIAKLVDERGLKTPVGMAVLAVPPDLWNVAEELLNSEYVPYSGNNERNALLKKKLNYFEWTYLTDTDGWLLASEKSGHKLKFFWRVRPGQLRKGTDFDTTNLKHLQRMRFSCGYSHYQGVYGSKGA